MKKEKKNRLWIESEREKERTKRVQLKTRKSKECRGVGVFSNGSKILFFGWVGLTRIRIGWVVNTEICSG